MENKIIDKRELRGGAENRPKMPIARRAKQFMPFAALKGLDEALARKEWEVSAREAAKHRIIKT